MKKTISLVFIIIVIVLVAQSGVTDYLSFEYLKSNQLKLQNFYLENQLETIFIYTLIYILVTAFSIPGAVILTLAGGALFGLVLGTAIISFSSTIGATLAFLAARYFFRDSIQRKFGHKLETLNRGIEKDGAYYLFTLRLIPAFPFFIINMLMGLTPIKTSTYFIVSGLGMLAGTIVYVNAGTQLAKIESPGDILSFNVIGAFILLGLLPLMAKKVISYLKHRRGN